MGNKDECPRRVEISTSVAQRCTPTRDLVVDPSNPTTAESLNAVKRTDDASTAARAEIDNLIESISKGFDVYDRASFEAAFSVVWSEATTSKA